MKTFWVSEKTRCQSLLFSILGLLLMVLCASNVPAQEFRASITGQVQDSTGAVITGATVAAVNNDTDVRYAAKTDNLGLYNLLYILPGRYTVTVECADFQTVVYKNVILNSAQQLGLNVTLKPKGITSEVVVQADALALDTISSSTGGVIDRVKVENMPSTGKIAWDSVIFSQGVRSNSAQPFNLTPRNNAGSQYTVAGTQSDSYAYFVNGAPVSDQGSWYFTASGEAVDQLQASVMPYDAQYGRSGGATFNSNIKAGTNKFHGVLADYFGNSVLMAATWNNNLNHASKGANNRNDYIAQLGGPIFRNKTFFFANFEGFRQRQTTMATSTVPYPDVKNGDFSTTPNTTNTGHLSQIYDPATLQCTSTNSTGGCLAYQRSEFSDNGILDKIPADRVNPVGKAIISYYPDPNIKNSDTGLWLTQNNYSVRNPVQYQYDQYIARIDHSFTDNTRIYGLYTRQNNNQFQGNNMFPNEASTQGTQPQTDWNIIFDLMHILSSSRVLDVKASYGKYVTTSFNGVAIQKDFQASKLGLNMPMVGTVGKSITPTFTFSTGAQLFANTSNGTEHANGDVSVSLTQQLRRHSLHFGGEFMDIQQANTGMLGNPYGTFSFNLAYTQSNPQAASSGQGNAWADLLLGYPSGGSLDWNQPYFAVSHYWGLFLQDDFKIRSNLTLNLGLRWDVNTSPYDRHNRINAGFCTGCMNPLASLVSVGNVSLPDNAQVSPLVGGLQFAGVNGKSSLPYNVSWTNWQPRIGFAWNFRRNTVLRGGYGLYYPWIAMDVDTYGFSQTTSYVPNGDQTNMPSEAFASGSPYPYGVSAPSGNSLGLTTNVGNSISFNDTDRITRRTQHWSLGIQHKLPWELLLDVQYLGSQVNHLPVTQSLGVITNEQQAFCYANGSLCNANVPNPFYGAVPLNSAVGTAQIAAWKLMRAYPLFNGVSEQRVPIGSSHFNSLDVRVERRIQNVNLVFDYAYANWMTKNTYLNSGNFRDDNLWYGLDPGDVRHVMKVNVVYPLPKIHKQALLDYVVNGWQVVPTFIYQTGIPFSLPTNGNFNWGAPIAGGGTCNSFEPPEGQSRLRWWNNHAECWHVLGTWERLTTPHYIGSIRSQARVMLNGAVQKNFTVWPDRLQGRFRVEAYNAANHPVFPVAGNNINNINNVACTPIGSMNCNGPGTLAISQENIPRNMIASLKFTF